MSASNSAMCDRKHPYPDKKAAQAGATALRAARGPKATAGLSVYKCPSCRSWHIGRDRRFRRS